MSGGQPLTVIGGLTKVIGRRWLRMRKRGRNGITLSGTVIVLSWPGACSERFWGRYLNLAPQDVRFSYTEYGKPHLPFDLAPSDITFNLTHSHELAMLAVTRARQIGVDLEYVRPDLESESIAERFFARAEVTTLLSQPPPQRTEAFFHCWTRKEAFIKAVGEGLSYPLDQFTDAFTPESPPALLEIRGSAKEARRWALFDLAPGEGYAGALAVQRKDTTPSLQRWQWQKSPDAGG